MTRRRRIMTKIYILGLDGLEFNFVEKWDLKNLKQLEYGKISVPISEREDMPMTPQVWGSFLTGKVAATSLKLYKPPLESIIKILDLIPKSFPLKERIYDFFRRIIPIRYRYSIVMGYTPLKMKTFLDITNSKPINVIFYNDDNLGQVINHHFGVGKISLKRAIKLLEKLYKKRKRHILFETGEFKEDYELILAYMHFPDYLHHYLLFRPSEIKAHYFDLDFFVSSLKKQVGDSTLFLLISDHGFSHEKEKHTNYGFYSSNVTLNPRPKRITDFYKIITSKIFTNR